MNEVKNEVERPANHFRVYEPKMEWLNGQIERLNKRAAKLGVEPIVLKPTGEVEDVPIYSKEVHITADPLSFKPERKIIGYRRFIWMEVNGSAPKFAGWSLAAVVEHAEEGNIIRKSPECKVELSEFRTGAPCCDHCKTVRNRKDTYIVLHESGARKMIGRNCIKDFLGHTDPVLLMRLAEFRFSVTEVCGEADDASEYAAGGFHTDRASVQALLEFACAAIRAKGFVSGKAVFAAREEGRYGLQSTKDLALTAMNPSPKQKPGVDYFLPDENDTVRANTARQYVLDTLGAQDSEALNDFEHNLLIACKCESVERRNMGIIAFVPEYYSRSLEKKTAAEKQASAASLSKYFGEVGKRARKVEIEYVKSTGWESDFGYVYLHTFNGPDNSRIMWKTGSESMEQFNPGDRMLATFTVKAHEDYKGWKQTKATRLKIDQGLPAATPAAAVAA